MGYDSLLEGETQEEKTKTGELQKSEEGKKERK